MPKIPRDGLLWGVRKVMETTSMSHKGSFDADELRNEINSVRQSLGLPPLYRSSRKRRPKQSINEPDVNIGSDDTRSIRMDL